LRGLELPGQVVRQAEVVPDVEVQCARRHVPRVGEAVGLDLVGHPLDLPGRRRQIRDREVEAAQRDVPVAAMPVEPCVVRVPVDACREDGDRLAIPPEVRQAPAEPDRRVCASRIRVEDRAGLGETGLALRPFVRGEVGREQRPAG